MPTLEEIFCKEFTQMMNLRKSKAPNFDIFQLDLPSGVETGASTKDLVFISGIEEEYYKALNNTEAILWSHGKLSRRKYDHTGQYIRENGKYVLQEVTLPHECVAVISKENIAVPTKFKSKEQFEYVDCINKKKPDGTLDVRRVYIIPRKYCYKMKQTALVISLNKVRGYYYGATLSLQNGYTMYMYVTPYKPRAEAVRSYRVIKSGTTIDYADDIRKIFEYWMDRGYLFNPNLCQITEGYKGRINLAYEDLPPTMEQYVRFNHEISMDKSEESDLLWNDDSMYIVDEEKE